MVKSCSDSNSDGHVIGDGLMDETWRNSSGDFLTILSNSGHLFINIQRKNANSGLCPAISFLILHLSKDGNILGKWALN